MVHHGTPYFIEIQAARHLRVDLYNPAKELWSATEETEELLFAVHG